MILQLGGVATGLIYIHGQGVIHGDLKGVRLRWPESCFYLTNFSTVQG
jgi:serine/threonine protein kinase